MSKRKRKKQKRFPAVRPKRSGLPEGLAVTSYQITCEPLHKSPYNVLPPEIEEQSEQLYHLVHSDPRQAIEKLERLIEQYPDVAKLYNFLGVAYQAIGDSERAKQVAEENYRRHPDYLFAKLNWAEECLREGRLDEIP